MRAAALAIALAVGAVGAVGAGCGGARWHAVAAPPAAVYQYDAPIARYAPDDAGFWIVTAREATPAGRARVARLVADPDDVLGDGFVVWATDERAAWLRSAAEVAAVVPLQPDARLAALGDTTAAPAAVPVRIELAPAVSAGQRDAVIAWLLARGVHATAIGKATVDAELTAGVARELATLGPVRWIERRAR